MQNQERTMSRDSKFRCPEHRPINKKYNTVLYSTFCVNKKLCVNQNTPKMNSNFNLISIDISKKYSICIVRVIVLCQQDFRLSSISTDLSGYCSIRDASMFLSSCFGQTKKL